MYILRQFLIRVLGFLFTVNMKKYEKKLENEVLNARKDKIRFRETPFLGDYMAGASFLFIYIMYVVFAVCIVCTVCCVVILPMEIQENADGALALMVGCGLVWLMMQGVKFIHLYYSREMTMYYDDYILVRSYKHEDKIITYEEIGETVRGKGIRVRKGRLELPFKDGMTAIYIHDNDPTLDKTKLIEFLNEKCKIKIPELTKKEKRLIRETGLFPVCFKTAIAVWLVDLGFMIMGAMIERSTKTFWNVYFPETIEMFFETHVYFFLVGAPFLLIGIIMKICNYIPFKVNLSKHKIFKV